MNQKQKIKEKEYPHGQIEPTPVSEDPQDLQEKRTWQFALTGEENRLTTVIFSNTHKEKKLINVNNVISKNNR